MSLTSALLPPRAGASLMTRPRHVFSFVESPARAAEAGAHGIPRESFPAKPSLVPAHSQFAHNFAGVRVCEGV